MKLFLLYRKYLALMGVEPLQPYQKNQAKKVFLKRFLVYTLCVLWLTCASIFIGFEAKTIHQYADAFYMSSCLTTILVVFSMFLWKLDIFFEFIEEFENLIEKQIQKKPESKPTYVKVNENIEKWTGVFFFFLVTLTVPAILLPNFIISYYHYFATDMGSEAFSLPFPAWTPFDPKTPIGYLIIFTIEFSATHYMAQTASCGIGTLVSSCYVVLTLCNEVKNDIHTLDSRSKAGDSPRALMKRVADIVEFHAATKQLAFNLNNTFAQIVIIYFLWFLASICGTLLMVQVELQQNANPIAFIKPLSVAFWSFSLLYLWCEFGQTLSDHFDQLNAAIDNCDWILFPKEIQKILPIIMRNTQRPIVLRTFENASCSRESFKNVTNRGFSLFMVFRKFK